MEPLGKTTHLNTTTLNHNHTHTHVYIKRPQPHIDVCPAAACRVASPWARKGHVWSLRYIQYARFQQCFPE